MASLPTFLPYHEPSIIQILTLTSLLLLLNILNTIFDRLLFCGLLGQVFIGVAYGTPGAKLLNEEVENVIVQLGYLGLVLLVYEGGLETNFTALKKNLYLSTAVAITGIALPIALSFTLLSLTSAIPLQAFAAGAALCSTSLGTTFTILSSSGLAKTRLGVVLSSAAMMDDVVGLVMVQVISNLGGGGGQFEAVTVVRPLAVSLGLGIAVPLGCRFVVKPLTGWISGVRKRSPGGKVNAVCKGVHTSFLIHTVVLVGLVTGATYAGTSNLFAAYLAGAAVSWWDSEVQHSGKVVESTPESPTTTTGQSESVAGKSPAEGEGGVPSSESEALRNEVHENSGIAVYHKYYATAVQRILKPFFFASIGFAIPIRDMFTGEIVWRGIVYTILMLFGKLATGVWLIRLNISWPKIRIPKSICSLVIAPASCFDWMYGKARKEDRNATGAKMESRELQTQKKDSSKNVIQQPTRGESSATANTSATSTPSPVPKISKPLSLYPAAMLGTAMTARGEIGFLIASLAETTGLFASSSNHNTGSSEIYLVVTWAIVLCTIIGPLSVGTLVKRVRRLQNGSESNLGVGGPLGIWGVG